MSQDSEAPPRPPGDYAIVELFGHTTLVGRISEVERFGAKMLALEPIFNGQMLGPVFHGGAAIYRLTPCTPAVAYENAPRQPYQLPPSLSAQPCPRRSWRRWPRLSTSQRKATSEVWPAGESGPLAEKLITPGRRSAHGSTRY